MRRIETCPGVIRRCNVVGEGDDKCPSFGCFSSRIMFLLTDS
jgi:hypothetical protein